MTLVDGVDYPADPNNPGAVLGWGVFRMAPWHFAGLCPTNDEATKKAQSEGAEYHEAFGTYWPGTDNFVAQGSLPTRAPQQDAAGATAAGGLIVAELIKLLHS